MSKEPEGAKLVTQYPNGVEVEEILFRLNPKHPEADTKVGYWSSSTKKDKKKS